MPGKGLPLTRVHKAPASTTFPHLTFFSQPLDNFIHSLLVYGLHDCLDTSLDQPPPEVFVLLTKLADLFLKATHARTFH